MTQLAHDLDLGCGHFLHYVRWAPDDLPANCLLYGTPLPNVEKAAAVIRHCNPKTGEWCEGLIHFDIPEVLLMRQGGRLPSLWKVESWEPLTLSPSIRCQCGDHGFIRNGQWVPA